MTGYLALPDGSLLRVTDDGRELAPWRPWEPRQALAERDALRAKWAAARASAVPARSC